MVLHGVPYDVGYLVEAAIIHAFHGMQDPSLHRLQSIDDMRHRPFQDDIGGIINEIVLVHSREAGNLYLLTGMVLSMGCL
jgi:hypothetical protein